MVAANIDWLQVWVVLLLISVIAFLAFIVLDTYDDFSHNITTETAWGIQGALETQTRIDAFELFCQSCGGLRHEASYELPVQQHNHPPIVTSTSNARWYFSIPCRECGGRGYHV